MDDFLSYVFLGALTGVVLIIGIIIGEKRMYNYVNKQVCTQSCQTLDCYTTCRNLDPTDFEKQVKCVGGKQ